ncbi:precorrin-3B C(17)-methyltransferase [Luteococcus sp. H138]|uniref:precorrin-3B C(17)-methyltransferase n=1 Tax=Luteococcus sp. H138 TaxID=3139404 RepID=UPI00313AAE41
MTQLVNSPAARQHADRIHRALGNKTTIVEGPLARTLPEAWPAAELIISHLALGATARIIAPLLASKQSDPGVVVVDEAGQFAVPLVGGHVGGANELARAISDALGGTAVLTTATDVVGIPALDLLGWAYEGDLPAVTRAMLDEQPVLLDRTLGFPVPQLAPSVSVDARKPVARIVVTDAAEADTATEALPTVTLHPRSLVVGMGCNKGTDVDELDELFHQTLAEAGLHPSSVTALTTVDVKAGELGLLQLAHRLGLRLTDYPADELATHAVPNPSEQAQRHVGCPSVSEASVLAHGAELVVPKHKSANATCAVGRLPVRGLLQVVGLGPGSRDLLTPRARDAIRRANLVVGYGPYVKQIRDLVSPGAEIYASKMGTEQTRTSLAIDRARAGERVVLVCGGDPAIYAMASPVLEQGTMGIDVEIVPGVTAELAVSAILGAPLGHDHATISLSDLHTDWQVIEQRLQGAAVGDFVVTLYNPRSRTRLMHLPRALEILGAHRPPSTPVAVVQQASRQRQKVITSTLADFQPEWVDMNSLVVVGSSLTRFVPTGSGRELVVTPRDYHWMAETSEPLQEER